MLQAWRLRSDVKSARPPNSNTTSSQYGLQSFSFHSASTSFCQAARLTCLAAVEAVTHDTNPTLPRGEKRWNRLTSPVTKQLFCGGGGGGGGGAGLSTLLEATTT